MSTRWRDLNHKGDPAKVAEHRRRMEAGRARDMTQAMLAQALDTTQPGISQIRGGICGEAARAAGKQTWVS